jgi:hypothetical protein
MKRERITEGSPWNDPRGQVMKTPHDVAEMMRLRACGWGVKRIARQLGCSHHTVEDYVAAGGVKPFKSPERKKQLDGLEGWLRERLIRHRGNADVVRQDLLAEKGVAVSRRMLQRAVQPYRQALKAEALATTLIRMMLSDMLVELGHNVAREANHLQSGLLLASAPGVDAAILDIQLGAHSSDPIAEVLKSNGVPFAFASGYGALSPKDLRIIRSLKSHFQSKSLSAV